MGEYDPDLLCIAATNILMQSAPGTQTKEEMKCAGLKKIYIKYDTYQKRIDILKKKIVASKSSQIVVRDGSIVASHLSQIVVRDRSTPYPSILTICYGETSIVRDPPYQVLNLVTPRKSMAKA